MNTLFLILIIAAFLPLFFVGLIWSRGFVDRSQRTGSHTFMGHPIFANAVPGSVPSSPGVKFYKAGAAISNRKRLVRQGAEDDEVLDNGAASNKPIGWQDDEADTGEEITVELFGAAQRTAVLTAAGAINAGDEVWTAADSKVQATSAVSGTYYKLGTALTSTTADGDEVEVDPMVPQEVTVA